MMKLPDPTAETTETTTVPATLPLDSPPTTAQPDLPRLVTVRVEPPVPVSNESAGNDHVVTTVARSLPPAIRADRHRGLLSWELVMREPRPIIIALLCAWTGLWYSLWFAGVGAVVGFWVGLIGGTIVGIPLVPSNSPSLGIIGGIVGIGVGATVFFAFAYGLSLFGIMYIIISMLTGGLIAWLITAIIINIEHWSMTVRGYRRLSDREAVHVTPIVEDVAIAMHLTETPTFLIHDIPTPGGWSHTRHIVLSKRSLDLERSQLAALIAHELHHWHARDAVKSTFIWACSLPVALLANVQSGAASGGGQIVGFLVMILFWPAMVLLRYVIAPITGVANRRCEYEADAAAADAGYGAGLVKMLESIRVFEPGRTGWDSVMAATHPPVELRIEALNRRHALSTALSSE
jgi:Zn-dependent protease with chaperone function